MGLTGTELALYLAFTELILKYGIPTAIKLYEIWNQSIGSSVPSKSDFDKLRNMVPHPSTYKKKP